MAGFRTLEARNFPSDQIDELHERLLTLPHSVVIFGESLRSLYNIYQVTGQDEATDTFLEVRDNTRKNGIVYAEKVLPMTEEVIRSIGLFLDFFNDLDFEDWSECLEDIIEGITRAIAYCDILKQMHNTIIVDLKKNEDKAKVGVEMLNKMSDRYREQAEQLKLEAKRDMKVAEFGKKAERYIHICTFGITKLLDLCYVPKIEAKKRATRKSLEAVAREENADIASVAVAMTTIYLIPAIANFIEGLDSCSLYLSDTKERLIGMNGAGKMGYKKPYYKMMKSRAKEVNNTTKVFLGVTDQMRNNLAAIPTEINDRNYVDQWFAQEMVKFETDNKGGWNEVVNYVMQMLF